MLIPRKPIDEEGNEIDPREELVQRLLEYKRYKSILDEMREMEETRSKQNFRGNVSKELRQIANKALVDAELENLTMFKLLKTFQRVMERFENRNPKSVHKIANFSYTVSDQSARILNLIKIGKRTSFESIFKACETAFHAIVSFLSVLELANLQKITFNRWFRI